MRLSVRRRRLVLATRAYDACQLGWHVRQCAGLVAGIVPDRAVWGAARWAI